MRALLAGLLLLAMTAACGGRQVKVETAPKSGRRRHAAFHQQRQQRRQRLRRQHGH